MNTCLNCHLPKHPNHSQFDTFCLKISGWKPEDFAAKQPIAIPQAKAA